MLSARRLRAARARGEEPICRDCRRKPPNPAELERMKRWWLERYTFEELLELGRYL
jgi:hypothetical protein